MRDGPDIARIGALLGDPARTHMLSALMSGQALTAGELAREAGVTAPTASSHLARLADGGLITPRKQGRCIYFALASGEVAELMEQLAGLAASAGHRRTRPGPRDPAIRRARVCYDHLAGELGVAMLDGLVGGGVIEDRGGALNLSEGGPDFVRAFGVSGDAMRTGRRPVCKACLDWSERRSHLAGALGAAARRRPRGRFQRRRLGGVRADLPGGAGGLRLWRRGGRGLVAGRRG